MCRKYQKEPWVQLSPDFPATSSWASSCVSVVVTFCRMWERTIKFQKMALSANGKHLIKFLKLNMCTSLVILESSQDRLICTIFQYCEYKVSESRQLAWSAYQNDHFHGTSSSSADIYGYSNNLMDYKTGNALYNPGFRSYQSVFASSHQIINLSCK